MEQWEALVTTAKTLLAILGGFTCIVGGVTAITKLFSPFKKLREQVTKHETQLSEDEAERDELRASIEAVAEADKMLCKVLLNLLDHEITGNHVDKLKKVRDELETFIIDNKF